MATPYFDVTSTNGDLLLLPQSVRIDGQLAAVAAIAERDVINCYTDSPPYFLFTNQLGLLGFFDASYGTGEDISNQSAPATALVPQLRVYLRGYKQDSSDPNVDPNLKQDMKMAIAEVIQWRMNIWKAMEPGLKSSSETGRNKVFRDDAVEPFPPNWTRWLEKYNSHDPLWGF